jgi:hypothetical protein
MAKMCYEDFKSLWNNMVQMNKKYAVVLAGKPYFVYCKSLKCFYLETITKDKSGTFYFATHKVSDDKTVHSNFLLKVASEEQALEWIEQHKEKLP